MNNPDDTPREIEPLEAWFDAQLDESVGLDRDAIKSRVRSALDEAWFAEQDSAVDLEIADDLAARTKSSIRAAIAEARTNAAKSHLGRRSRGRTILFYRTAGGLAVAAACAFAFVRLAGFSDRTQDPPGLVFDLAYVDAFQAYDPAGLMGELDLSCAWVADQLEDLAAAPEPFNDGGFGDAGLDDLGIRMDGLFAEIDFDDGWG